MATWNKLKALESARKLRSFQPALLAVGHGELLKQPCMALDQAIAEAERTLARTLTHGNRS
jgi:hypothetical protein